MIVIKSSNNPIVDVLRPAQKFQVWNTYIPGDGPSEHPPPPKKKTCLILVSEKNIPIYVKAKQTRNKSKIKVKQSKAKQVKSKLG